MKRPESQAGHSKVKTMNNVQDVHVIDDPSIKLKSYPKLNCYCGNLRTQSEDFCKNICNYIVDIFWTEAPNNVSFIKEAIYKLDFLARRVDRELDSGTHNSRNLFEILVDSMRSVDAIIEPVALLTNDYRLVRKTKIAVSVAFEYNTIKRPIAYSLFRNDDQIDGCTLEYMIPLLALLLPPAFDENQHSKFQLLREFANIIQLIDDLVDVASDCATGNFTPLALAVKGLRHEDMGRCAVDIVIDYCGNSFHRISRLLYRIDQQRAVEEIRQLLFNLESALIRVSQIETGLCLSGPDPISELSSIAPPLLCYGP